MSQTADALRLWTRDDTPGLARVRLRKSVAALTRARRVQVLVDHAFGGLLAGLGLATAAVLVARLAALPYSRLQLAGAAVIIALAVALLVGWWRRPDTLQVAIRADLMLRLKQRLSTAWEVQTLHGDDELVDRLAVQAVRAGLPTYPWAVFPLRLNSWGWLSPLAATALLLASVVDLDPMRAAAPRAIDRQVVGEGQRLGAFGREMQARAERDKLPRSAREAAQLERLGARMESGALSRSQAVGQLRQMAESLDQARVQALAEAGETGRGARRAQSAHIAPGLNPGAMLERMLRGELSSDDTRALTQRLDDLDRFGIPRRELENALERHRSGADDALRSLLEKMAQIERALKEDRELSGAREQVGRAQDHLGDSRAETRAEGGGPPYMDWDEEDARGLRSEASADRRRPDSRTAQSASGGASQGNSGVAAERQHSPLQPDAPPAGRVLAPQGQEREGEMFTSQGRMLPKSNQPRLKSVEMKAEFAAQVEAVLSREQYPAHYKAFIRRYFLSLSEGARAPHAELPAREEPRE